MSLFLLVQNDNIFCISTKLNTNHLKDVGDESHCGRIGGKKGITEVVDLIVDFTSNEKYLDHEEQSNNSCGRNKAFRLYHTLPSSELTHVRD